MLPPPELPPLFRLGEVLLTPDGVLRLGPDAGAFCTLLREFEEDLRILSENDLPPLPPLASVRVPKRFGVELLLRPWELLLP